jgi:hypothetical protein
MRTFLALLLLIPSISFSFCYEPSPPWSKPSKPTVPWCVNEWDNTHTFSDWEIDSYYNDVDNYNYEVRSYVNDLQNYLYEAEDYVNCEINNLNY